MKQIEHVKVKHHPQANYQPYSPVEIALIDKVNELVNEVNYLRNRLGE